MLSLVRCTLLGSTVVFAAGCHRGIEVQTMAAPEVRLSALHTFRMLPGPARRDGRPVNGDDDPMISNSIANRAIHNRIVAAFQERGYVLDERNADFGVAFYAAVHEKLDVAAWDYGYPFVQGSPRRAEPAPIVVQYTEGSVVIDVVRPGSGELLWRGEGKAELTDDASDNVRWLARAAEAIVARFPRGVTVVAAGESAVPAR